MRGVHQSQLSLHMTDWQTGMARLPLLTQAGPVCFQKLPTVAAQPGFVLALLRSRDRRYKVTQENCSVVYSWFSGQGVNAIVWVQFKKQTEKGGQNVKKTFALYQMITRTKLLKKVFITQHTELQCSHFKYKYAWTDKPLDPKLQNWTGPNKSVVDSPCGLRECRGYCSSSPWRPGHQTTSLSLNTKCTPSGDTVKCSTQTWCTHFIHTHTQTHHLGLPVTSCLEGKSCHSNKPQKRKYGYYDQTALGLRLEKHCDVGTETRRTHSFHFWCSH